MKTLRLAMIVGLVVCSGCTVVSANRTFPKLAWYWSAEAKEQRRERQLEKAQAMQTNSVPVSRDIPR